MAQNQKKLSQTKKKKRQMKPKTAARIVNLIIAATCSYPSYFFKVRSTIKIFIAKKVICDIKCSLDLIT